MKPAPVFVLLFLFSTVCCSAQKEYYIWYFGKKTGLSFHTSPPTVLSNGAMTATEGSSGICDKEGNLLFYAKEDSVFNSNHQLIKNGAYSIQRNSPVQAALLLPHVTDSDLFYMFNAPYLASYTDTFIRYSVISKGSEGGKGEVIVKDLPLIPGVNERMAVSVTSAGKNIWIAGIMTHRSDNESWLNVRQIKDGIIQSGYKSLPLGKTIWTFANIRFSPDGKTFIGERVFNENQTEKGFALYKFNPQTGEFSGRLVIPEYQALYNAPYCEFSPGSGYLYVQRLNKQSTFELVQYDLNVWDSAAILHSERVLATGVAYPSGMQLGPDGKIYYFSNGSKYLGVIDNPDMPGLKSGFRDSSLYLSGLNLLAGVPYYPGWWFRKSKLKLGKDTVICEGDTLRLNVSVSDGFRLSWNTGDTSNSIQVMKAGWYIATETDGAESFSDSIYVYVGNRPKVFIGNDSTFCGKFSVLLSAGKDFKDYRWSTGDTTFSILANTPDRYSVRVADSNSCHNADTILLNQVFVPDIQIRYDTLNCNYTWLTAHSQTQGLRYVWSTGDTGSTISITQPGIYILKVSNQFCNFTDTIEVSRLVKPELNLGKDTLVCMYPFELTANEGDIFVWSTGEQTQKIKVWTPGMYWVKSMYSPCIGFDTIMVMSEPICESDVFIPNAFTPGGDGLNEVFRVYGTGLEEVTLSVYSAWGECLFQETGKEPVWNGMYKGKICQPGVYFYQAVVKIQTSLGLIEKRRCGTISLLN